MSSALLDPDSSWLGVERERLLEFGHAAAVPAGFGWLDDAGQVDPAKPLPLYLTARMTHVYALGHLLGHDGSAALADHGLAALRGAFADDVHGGWYGELDADGVPTGSAKTAYEHAFVVLAAASASAAERPGAGALLDDALAVFLRRFWDDDHAMVVEEWDASFTTLDGYRGANANMHSVEALLTAADLRDDGGLRERALAIARRLIDGQARAHEWRLPEHYDEDWRPVPDFNADRPADPFRPYGATVGHGLEWARLCVHLHAALGERAPDWLVPAAASLFDRAVADGWAADGTEGFCYTTDWSGRPVVRERMHWVAAEAVGAAAALHAVTGEQAYADRYAAWWRHIRAHFVDLDGGSWWHELTPDLAVGRTVWDGKPDLYHAVGATLVPVLPVSRMLAPALAGLGR